MSINISKIAKDIFNPLEFKSAKLILNNIDLMIINIKKPRLAWIKEHFYLSEENSAITGQFIPFKYQEAIIKACEDENIRKIYVMKSARVGYSKILLANLQYDICEEKCPIIVGYPNEKSAIKFSKNELEPLIRDSDTLSSAIINTKKDNTTLSKRYNGGAIDIGSMQSASFLAQSTKKRVYVDEADLIPILPGIGNPIDALYKRSETYFDRFMLVGGNPMIKGYSNIEKGFNLTDKNMFFVPCPNCSEKYVINFNKFNKNYDSFIVIYDKVEFAGESKGVAESARLLCPNCEVRLEESDRYIMINDGEYRQTTEFICCESKNIPLIDRLWDAEGKAICKICNKIAPYNSGSNREVGYFISSIYNPIPSNSLENITREFLEAKSNPEKLRVFVNTRLGEPFEVRKIAKYDLSIFETKMMDVDLSRVALELIAVTMSVDTQDDRLEYEIRGWGADEISIGLVRKVIEGNTALNKVWQDLQFDMDNFNCSDIKNEEFEIAITVVDIGGHRVEKVKDFIFSNENVYGIKGSSVDNIVENRYRDINFVKFSSEKSYYNKLAIVSTNEIKEHIFDILKEKSELPNNIYFNSNSYDEKLLKQVIVEFRKFDYNKNGYLVKRWIKPSGARNESLDLLVYNFAAMTILKDEFAIIFATEEI